MADRNEPEGLEQRRRKLEDALAARRPSSSDGEGAKQNTKGGFGNAFKLSGEFIGGVVVGIGLGWFFDQMLGTTPWGLIVFLLLGFAAGVLNVLRATGQVAEFGSTKPGNGSDDPQRK